MKAPVDQTQHAVTRRTYTAGDKRSLIRLAQQSSSVKNAALKLGIAISTANRWFSTHQASQAKRKARQAENMRKLRLQKKGLLAARLAPPAVATVPAIAAPVRLSPALAAAPGPAPVKAPPVKGGVTLSGGETAMVMAMVRECLRTSKDLDLVRQAAQLALRLLP